MNLINELHFATIDLSAVSDALLIESRSNPHAWSTNNLRSAFQQFEHLGIFQYERLIAFVIYQLVLDEAEIIHLVCDRDEQGKGYAKRLLLQWLDSVQKQGINRVFLEVRERNASAIKLYQHLGFVENGRRRAYYKNGEDALLMQW